MSQIKRLLDCLDKAERVLKLELTDEDIIDALWLALHIQPTDQSQINNKQNNKQNLVNNQLTEPSQPQQEQTQTPGAQTIPTVPVVVHNPNSVGDVNAANSKNGAIFKAPSAPALREPLKLAKALRPLMLKAPSNTQFILDEEATAHRIAEEKIYIPVLQPALEPWLEVALVIDEFPSMAIWKQTLVALQKLLEGHGAFRDVRTWGMIVEQKGEKKEIWLCSRIVKAVGKRPIHKPGEIVDPSGRRLILVVSDCVSPAWRDGSVTKILSTWERHNPVAIVQMLPEWLWERSALGLAAPVKLRSLIPGTPNQKLKFEDLAAWDDIDTQTGVKVPVVTLEPEPIKTWAQMLAGAGDTKAVGFIFEQPGGTSNSEFCTQYQPSTLLSSEQRVYRFLNNASFTARKLAGLLAAAPVMCLPVVQMIQEKILQESGQVHVAEVFLGGLLKSVSSTVFDTDPDITTYDFIEDEIRTTLLSTVSNSSSIDVLNKVSEFVEENAGLSVKSFMAKLLDPTLPGNQPIDDRIRPFAKVTYLLLKRLGGQAAEIAQRLEQQLNLQQNSPIVFNLPVHSFSFEVVTVNRSGAIIKREPSTAQYFKENLGDVTLDMVVIPGGTFTMGAPEDEEDSTDDERPQHEVTVKPFFIGKYPITQAQWRAVAALPQINRELEPEPSDFKGDDLPVECVSWYDAVEFCDRLSKHSGRNYRLPSEAEWEYACRAGTSTPFYLGDTITSELANFRGTETYADAPKGEYREKTTSVGIFPPNHFGLYDMHGNVWEWCADDWHEDYSDAPSDGRAWIEEDQKNDNDNHSKLLRGGSWYNNPHNCRSAYRYRFTPGYDNLDFGFRVVCGGAARIL